MIRSGIIFGRQNWQLWGGAAWRGVACFSRPLRYRNQAVKLTGGQISSVLVGQEKGIDIRIALDIVRMARERKYDVGLVFSQDQDLSEVAAEVKSIALEQQRWIKLACAFPASPTYQNTRGINGTEWITIERSEYDKCLDLADHRPKKGRANSGR